jgi:DNA-binding transcriptional LysR family regulator
MVADTRRVSLDWNDVRFFLAVARERTLVRAGVALGVDQTTVGRRLASLEEKLRVALFVRSSGGFELTACGERVVASAARMEQSALELSAQALCDASPFAGMVRIATSEWLAERFVLPGLREVQARHPGIEAVVLTGWDRVDLRGDEADLATRLVRPTDPRLAFRRLGELSLRLYASREYLARRGVPDSLAGHQLVAYEDAARTSGQAFTNVAADGGQVALRTNSGQTLVAAAVAGIGIAQLPRHVADATPDLVPVLRDREAWCTVWLVLPQAKRRIAAVRVISEAIHGSCKRSAASALPRPRALAGEVAGAPGSDP